MKELSLGTATKSDARRYQEICCGNLLCIVMNAFVLVELGVDIEGAGQREVAR